MFQPYVSASAAERVTALLASRWIGQGGVVDEFERAVEKTLKIPHAVAVNASSSAIRLALSICGVGPGDEVITTPMTCTLTNHPILEQYGRIVFADIQYGTGNIDPSDVERRITRFTKAIVCTHWAGQPADLSELNEIAARHGVHVIEDASEAFGATYKGQPIGAVSPFAAFSFQAIQIVTTGEGGILCVRDDNHNRLARSARWYAIDRDRRVPNDIGYYDFDISSVGFGYHMTNLAAAIGCANLLSLEQQAAHRSSVVQRYRSALAKVAGISLLEVPPDRVSSNHFFTMHVERRSDFCRKMRELGIETSIVHYRNDVYSVFGGVRRDLPSLDRFAKSYIGLPTHMHLNDEDLEYVVQSIQAGW